MNPRTLLLPLAAVAALVAPARAQDSALELDLQRIAASWSRGDAAGVLSLAAEEGVSLELADGSLGPLSGRQAAAVLRRIFEGKETLLVRAGLSEVVGGTPERAFGMMTWRARAEGTTSPELYTIFVAFVRRDGHWRLTQIRILR